MNLRVDLILEHEQRSATWLDARSLTRIATFAVPALLLLFVGINMLRIQNLKREVRRMEARWAGLHPQQQAAISLQGLTKENLARLDELELWDSTRATLYPLLDALRRFVPKSVQLTEMHLTEEFAVVERQGTMRTYRLVLVGKADGPTAKDDVETLTHVLRNAPPFGDHVVSATVPPGAFHADRSPGAPETRRDFRIHVDFRGVPFK